MHSGNLHCLKAVVVMADRAVGYLNSVCSDHRHHACRRENFLRCVFNHLDSRSKMQICRCRSGLCYMVGHMKAVIVNTE